MKVERLIEIGQALKERGVEEVNASIFIFPGRRERFAEVMKKLGSGKKTWVNGSLSFRADCAPEVEVYMSEMCTKKVVGVRHVPEQVIPEKIIPAHDEEIVEWECDGAVLKKGETAVEKVK